jgi:WhiB family redox-sensing transcriptional regulator
MDTPRTTSTINARIPVPTAVGEPVTDNPSYLAEAELTDIFGLPEEQSWQERALCSQTDPEAFFPEKGGSTREAKKICVGCEVRGECLEYALEHDERFGIWGGLSERERRRIKRRAS